MPSPLTEDQLLALRKDWITGLLSVRLLRIKHGLTEDAQVEAIAAEHRFPPRNLRTRIQEETQHALIDRTVSTESSATQPGSTLINDDEQMAMYAQQAAGVVESQRTAANKGRVLADRFLDELAELVPPKVDENAIKTLAAAVEKHNPELASHLREHIGPTSPHQKMNFLTRRIGMLRTVSEAHERYIGLERQAWGLDEKETGQLEFDQALAALEHR